MTGAAAVTALRAAPPGRVTKALRGGSELDPAGWEPLTVGAVGGYAVWVRDAVGAAGRLVVTVDTLEDERPWLHASLSFPARLPTYWEVKAVKAAVFGPDREAYQVFPPDSEHVNVHETCLHLWGRVDGVRVVPP